MHSTHRAALGAVVLVTATALTGTASAAPSLPKNQPVAVSVSTTGVLGDGYSDFASVSADGKYVAFASSAANLVPGDTNGIRDVFVRDLKRGLTRRASVTTDGTQAENNTTGSWAGNASSYYPYLSGDGRYLLFTSVVDNLVPGDTNDELDVFVRDLRHGITTRVSLGDKGQQGSLVFGTGISGDGRYVVLTGFCGCLVAGDSNFWPDVMVRDLKKGTLRIVSRASDGTQANGSSDGGPISADGRYVVFTSYASNLVPGDTNGTIDVFRHDLKTGETIRVSVGPGGRQATGGGGSWSPSVSKNGRLVAFTSDADGLVDGAHGARDVYVRDLKTGVTTLVTPGIGGPANAAVSTAQITAEGGYVGFQSAATNLVPGDTDGATDFFVRDLKRGTTRLIAPTVEVHGSVSLDDDGEVVAFESESAGLVPGDTNGTRDVVAQRIR
jgi:Tol biopolymer transport system component